MNEIGVALLVALRILVPGSLWLAPATSPPTGADRLDRAGRIIVLGLLLNLVPALLLAQCARWSPGLDWLAWGVVVAVGFWKRGAAAWSRAALCDAAVAGGWIALVTGILLALPPRSEWLAGGWDPGIYQNSAVVADRAHGFVPRVDSIFAELTPAERDLFSSAENAYREVMPAVPIDRGSGALLPYFFPLMPVCGALFHRWGGLDLLVRINGVLAWLALPAVFALAGVLRLRLALRLALVGAWLVSPLWWYHQAIPTTELLQLLLLMGAALFYADAQAVGKARPWLAALLLALAVINHFGYAALVAPLVLALAVGEAQAAAPGRLGRILLCSAGLLAGAGWDLLFSGVTWHRLQDKDHVLPVILIPLLAFLAVSSWVAWRGLPARLTRGLAVGLRAGCVLLALSFLAVWSAAAFPAGAAWLAAHTKAWPLAGEWITRLVRLQSFHGLAFLAPAALGGLALALDRESATARLRLLAGGLLAVLLLLLVNPGIAPIYPWAFRRYVVFLVPLLAALQAFVIAARWPAFPRRPRLGRIIPLLLSACLLYAGVLASRRAAAVGDYVGVRAALEAAKGQIGPRDVVIADDARWGTPLLMSCGRDVLDGGLLWRKENAADRDARLQVLARLAQEGRRLLWLTSTEKGTGLYPFPMPGAQRVGGEQKLAYRTVIHSSRANAFASRETPAVLALWEWRPYTRSQ